MTIKVNFKMGLASYQIDVDEKDPMDALHTAIVLSNPRRECNICKAVDGFYFTSNKDKEGNTYVNVKCQCGSRSKLGQYKAGGYFWHEFEKYEPKPKENTGEDEGSEQR
jgi:hypothetical protein